MEGQPLEVLDERVLLFLYRRHGLLRVGLRLGDRVVRLDRVAAELVAQGRVHLCREGILAPGGKALVKGRGDDRRRNALVDRVLDRPAALTRVLDVRLEPGQVVALLLEGEGGE